MFEPTIFYIYVVYIFLVHTRYILYVTFVIMSPGESVDSPKSHGYFAYFGRSLCRVMTWYHSTVIGNFKPVLMSTYIRAKHGF